jgi:hypothetical protein
LIATARTALGQKRPIWDGRLLTASPPKATKSQRRTK